MTDNSCLNQPTYRRWYPKGAAVGAGSSLEAGQGSLLSQFATPNLPMLVSQGSGDAFIEAVALLMEELYIAAGVDPAVDPTSLQVASMGGTAEAGMLAAAIRLRGLLLSAPDGVAVLSRVGWAQGALVQGSGQQQAELRIRLWGESLAVKAFRDGTVLDSFSCTDEALARNLGELLPALRGQVSSADRG